MKYILSSRQFESLESGSNTDLKSYLISYGIPVDEWGKGYAKTIWHLEKEIESGAIPDPAMAALDPMAGGAPAPGGALPPSNGGAPLDPPTPEASETPTGGEI